MVAFFTNVFSIIFINWLTAMYKMRTFIFSTWIEFVCSLSIICCLSDFWIFKIYCIISIDIPKVVQDNWLPFFETRSAITKHFQNFLLFIHPLPNFKLHIIFESNDIAKSETNVYSPCGNRFLASFVMSNKLFVPQTEVFCVSCSDLYFFLFKIQLIFSYHAFVSYIG